ncbi:hypothetical protein ACH4PU_32725 [Streptomyces sp. NPDC021100]|uniref:hypothetical protein n=1 Tax=Streptomyces sp. NPDC021100 TaxID=3365114 RepID=UPI00378DC360
MSIATASHSTRRPATYRALPVLRIAALLLTLPALSSGAPALLTLALASLTALGAWMVALAFGMGGARPGPLPRRITLVLIADGFVMSTVAGFLLGMLTLGGTATALSGLLVIAAFGAMSHLHRKARRATRRNRRR